MEPNLRQFSVSVAYCQSHDKVSRTTTVSLTDSPSGSITADSALEDLEPAIPFPKVAQQVRDNIQKYEGCVILTRVGNFYELYFEQAEEYGPLLAIKVASKKTSAGPVPMAGFPFFQLERFLKILVQDHGKHVAIAEEVANDASQKVRSGGLLFDRQVKRIVTPGTLIDESFIKPYEHNYLLAVFTEPGLDSQSASSAQVGLSWLDLSSGDFFTQNLDVAELPSAIARISPREIVLESELEETYDPRLASITAENKHNITYHKPGERTQSTQDWTEMLESAASHTFTESFSTEETLSANLLLEYVQSQLPGLKLRVQSPQRWKESEFMSIDKNTLRGLEVVQTMRDGSYKGSLLHAIRRTSTESGARLLAQRLGE